jgi:peptidoglycan/LPS O-acetylase OafA/YrhL
MTGRSASARIFYLDGLRGFAALVVLFAHTLLVFGEPLATIHEPYARLDALVATFIRILGLLLNGNSAVCIFFILSGYVMADFAHTTTLALPAQLVRRYVRLAVPILITSTCAYLLLRFGLFRNTEATRIFGGWAGYWYQFEPSAETMAYEALIGTFLDGTNAYNSNLWTMHAELQGSFYVLLIGAIARKRGWRTALYAYLAAYHFSDYLPVFAVGALLREYDDIVRRYAGAVASVPIATFVIGCYLCSLPELSSSGQLPRLLYPLPQFSYDNTRYWHSIGAVLVLIGVLGSPWLQRPLGSPLGKLLGRISFTLYLIHVPILCSLGAWLILHFAPRGNVTAAAIGLPVSIVACLGIAVLLSPVVDGSAILLSRKIGRRVDDMLAGAIKAVRVAVRAKAAWTPPRVLTAPHSTHAASSASVAKLDRT